MQLPIFPASSTAITNEIGFWCRDGIVCYFNGHLPVFSHPIEDIASFRFFTSQLIANGNASQSQIAKAFGVPLVSVKRACKTLRTRGAGGFFRPAPPRRGHRLTPERLEQAQALLDQGLDVPTISKELGVLASTLHKAISSGRLKKKR
jgi:transposase-like protein